MKIVSRTPVARTAVALAAAVAAFGSVAMAAGPAAASSTSIGAGSDYVALGDSYAAGYGIPSPTGKPVAGCAQSTHDYPHQIATALKLHLTDVSCSGAVTANLDTTPQVTSDGTAPLQDKALTTSTKLVTVTIGGNDLGFAKIAAYCLADSPVGPLTAHPSEANCKAHYAPPGGRDSLADTVKNVVVPRVARILADIRAKAPNAHVYFIDYPAISTTKAGVQHPSLYPDGCFSPLVPETFAFPFTGVDTVYLQGVQAKLNAALATRVKKSGDTFVESYPQSLSHSACADTQDTWLNGIKLVPSAGTGVTAAPGSLHPNREGADHLAAEALVAIRQQIAADSAAARRASAKAGSTATPTSAAARPAAASTSLARSGFAEAPPLALGLLLLVAGGGLLVATRRRPERH